MLAKLLEELNKIENLNWIRVLYTYPTNFNDDLIKAYQKLDKVVKYVDIPLQHSHPDVLKAMRRPAQDYEKLIKKIRKIKNVCIRTTLITGYPTESEEHFEHLYNFVEKIKFDRLGIFEFSREKGTYAYSLKPQILAKVKRERKNKIMKMQAEISKEINKSFIGKEIECIVEQINSNGLVVARSFRDAPEVDGVVYIKTEQPLCPCDIVKVKITGADTYNLFGKI
jgi:ribosomal protein S12 methylthiotransferase